MSDRAKDYAYLAYRMQNGDDVSPRKMLCTLDQLARMLIKDGYADSDGEWIYDDGEDEEEVNKIC